MAIRKAVVADQVAMAKLAATAFFNDELFVLIHPYRHEFPDDMHLYWLANIQRSWPYSFNHYLVSTVQDALDGQEEIVAWAQWTRKGRQTQEIRASIPKPEINLPTNRAADPTKEGVLEQAYELVGHVEWSGMIPTSSSGQQMTYADRSDLQVHAPNAGTLRGWRVPPHIRGRDMAKR